MAVAVVPRWVVVAKSYYRGSPLFRLYLDVEDFGNYWNAPPRTRELAKTTGHNHIPWYVFVGCNDGLLSLVRGMTPFSPPLSETPPFELFFLRASMLRSRDGELRQDGKNSNLHAVGLNIHAERLP